MNRRRFLMTGAAALGGLSTPRIRTGAQTTDRPRPGRIPLIHITDLYHPPQDPDDHFDLATIAALEEYDLKGVILDNTDRFLDPPSGSSDVKRDPGFVPVIQMAYLLGRDIPVAAGPRTPLANSRDDVANLPLREQAGVHLLLDILEHSASKVVVSVVGSCRVLTAACNRKPALCRSRVQSVLLNAGSLGGPKQEWNVGLDPQAYRGIWQSGLPIHWFPCATERGAFDPDHERGTYWKTTHSDLIRKVSPALQSWFAYALTGSNCGDIIRVLSETPSRATWDALLAQERNLWATASLVMSAGRVLAKTAGKWRFISSNTPGTEDVWPWRLDPIEASVNEHAEVQWRAASGKGHAMLFGRKGGREFGAAMSEALCALLASI